MAENGSEKVDLYIQMHQSKPLRLRSIHIRRRMDPCEQIQNMGNEGYRLLIKGKI